MEIDTQGLSRRGLVTGGAALGAGALLAAGGATAAHADPGPGSIAGVAPGNVGNLVAGPDGEPSRPRIGSALIGGYSYQYRSFYSFTSFSNGARNFVGPYGAWSTEGQLRTELPLPPGAVLRDVEYYVSTTAAMSVFVWLWATGEGYIAQLANGVIPAGAAGLRAVRISVPATGNGPFSPGSSLIIGVEGTSATKLLNGIRVGYSAHPAGVVMLPAPVRAYDSRSGAKIGNGQTRIHSLAGYIPAGATAAIVNLTATSGESSGGLAIYNTGSSLPSGSLVYYNGGTTESNEVHCKLPSDRKVKVTMRGVPGCKVHYFIDVLGYTA